jgi:HSP20 family molecular chaperone IbpA
MKDWLTVLDAIDEIPYRCSSYKQYTYKLLDDNKGIEFNIPVVGKSKDDVKVSVDLDDHCIMYDVDGWTKKITLRNTDLENSKAKVEHGLLTITVPFFAKNVKQITVE